MANQNGMIENIPSVRPSPLGPIKVIKKVSGLYRSKRYHFQQLLLLAITILSLIFGILYFHNCPIQPRIPIFLIVQGATGILLFAVHILSTIYILCITKFKYHFIWIAAGLNFIISLFLFAWFITGNVWIFSVTKRVQFTDQTKSDSYCNGTFFHFSFWLLIVQYILIVYFCCSLLWIPQSAESPTNGIIKIRKQIPKIRKKIRKRTRPQPTTTTQDIIEIRL